MGRTRWVEDSAAARPERVAGGAGHPEPRGHVPHRSRGRGPRCSAKPLEVPPEPHVHVRICDINIVHGDFVHRPRRLVRVDAMWNGKMGEYPLLIPIDLEPALAISREKFGEPKKLAEIELDRDGDHVRGASLARA